MMARTGRTVRLTGTLERADLGPGAWTLSADDGTRYVLDGTVPSKLADHRVTVIGTVTEGVSFAMAGPVLRVKTIQPR